MIQEEKVTDSTEEKTIEKAERKYEYWLACVASVSRKKKRRLRTTYGSAKKIYNIIEERGEDFFPNPLIKDIKRLKQAKKGWDLDGKYEEARQREIWFVGEWERGFPARLAEIPDPPYALFVKGNLPDESCMSASIVGSRECTPYGELQTLKFAKTLAGCGVQIISGMAKGIDGHAHRGALQGNGKTFAVLGCGVDVCYPREHIGLYADILEHEGGILSEYPPGTTPEGWNFPQRNRLISGLGDFLLVMEAKEKSGSLITVDLALEQGKDIYALPGPVSSPLSKGCNRLIHQGGKQIISGILPHSFQRRRIGAQPLQRHLHLLFQPRSLRPIQDLGSLGFPSEQVQLILLDAVDFVISNSRPIKDSFNHNGAAYHMCKGQGYGCNGREQCVLKRSLKNHLGGKSS